MTLLTPEKTNEVYDALHNAGYRCFDWTCANNDRYLVGKPEDMDTVDYLIESAISTVATASKKATMPKILLMHDSSAETLEALPAILEALIAEGYHFGTLDELDGDWMFR